MTTWNADGDGGSTEVDFDTSAVPPREAIDAIPDGDYHCLIEKVSIKTTKDGEGKRAEVRLRVVDGPMTKRVVFDGINIVNRSEKAQLIGRQQLAELLESAGKKGERDLATLVQCEVIAKVRTQPAQDGYEARNVVRAYRPLGGVQSAPVATQVQAQEKKQPAFMSNNKGAAKAPTLQK